MATSIAPTIDATGIHTPQFVDIYNYLVSVYQTIFGSAAYVAPDSQDGQLLAAIAAALNDWNADTVAAYNAFSPSTAQGVGLSSIVKLNGLARAVPTQSTVDLQVVGVAGTIITNGKVQDANQTKWDLPATVTIPNAGTITVTAVCEVQGAITAQAGTVTSIITPMRGWQTVTNAAPASPGSPVETDAALRQRQTRATQLAAVSALGSLYSGLGQITGVTAVAIRENATDVTDSAGVTPHCIATVVAGGDVNAIANMIALKKSDGCNTQGSTSIMTTDVNGLPITINFSRPTPVAVNVVLNVKALAGYSASITAKQQAAVAAYLNAFGIGVPLLFTRLWPSALLSGTADASTFEVVSMTANGGTADINVTYLQQIIAGTVTVNLV